jgi:DNA-binding IclR family transcriptional regulator
MTAKKTAKDSTKHLELDRGKPVGAVIAAADILEFLGRATSPVTGGVIARELNLNRSTCFNILRTLTARGLLMFDEAIRSYTLGPRMISLARRALDPSEVAEAIRPQMQRVAEAFHIPISAWRILGGRLILIARAESDTPVRIHMSLGQRLPLLSGSVGRVVAGALEMSDEEIVANLDGVRWHTPVSQARFIKDARQVRSRGWAIDNGDFFPGMLSISVPIFDQHGKLQIVCSATALKGQLSKVDQARLAEDLRRIALVARSEDVRSGSR